MPKIVSIGEFNPPYVFNQEATVELARQLFQGSFSDIERLLNVFDNGQIVKRHFSESLDWYKKDHSFEEKNNRYIEKAVTYGVEAIKNCLTKNQFLKIPIPFDEIDAIFFISTTGIATPSIEARIMNQLTFSPHTKRIPIWGLGCAGGAAGLARGFEYCKAFPHAKVLVLSIELCSLTFQKNDLSKSNLIGMSLFADGVACACLIGDEVEANIYSNLKSIPAIIGTESTLMKDSLDVMGWDIKNEGLYVVFSKDIPSIISSWLKTNVIEFLHNYQLTLDDLSHFIAHPGGKKVLEAYEKALGYNKDMTAISLEGLTECWSMSSATVLYVLKRFMESDQVHTEEHGLAVALGPGFSSELVLLQWR